MSIHVIRYVAFLFTVASSAVSEANVQRHAVRLYLSPMQMSHTRCSLKEYICKWIFYLYNIGIRAVTSNLDLVTN